MSVKFPWGQWIKFDSSATTNRTAPMFREILRSDVLLDIETNLWFPYQKAVRIDIILFRCISKPDISYLNLPIAWNMTDGLLPG